MTSLELARDTRDTLAAPELIREAWTLASRIAATEFVPAAFRGKPEAVLAAMLTGREVGMGPMSALQRIHVIQGKPCIDAQGQRALVLAAGHDIWQQEATPTSCTYAGRRAGSENTQTVTWTIKDAQAAGLASKEMWKKYPRQMLAARASAELCRLIAPDAIQGLGLTVEELQDTEPTIAQPTSRPKVQRRPVTPIEQADLPAGELPSFDDDDTATAGPDTPPAPAPVDDIVDADIVEPDQPAPATQKQINLVMLRCNRQAISDDDRHALVEAHTAGRTTHVREMTGPEISALIDSLNTPEGDNQ